MSEQAQVVSPQVAATWSPEQDISQVATALGPDVRARADGQLVASYNLSIEGGQEVWEVGSVDGGLTWGRPVKVGWPNGSTRGTAPLQSALAPDGSVWTLWDDYNPNRTLTAMQRLADGSDAPPSRVTNFDTNGGAITVGPNNVIYASYARVYTSGQDTQVEFIYSADGGRTWSTPVEINGRGTYSATTAIALNGSNHPLVIFEEAGGGSYNLKSRAAVGGVWQEAIVVFPGRAYWYQTDTAPDGKVGLVFQANAGGNIQIYYTCWTESGGWSIPVPVSSPDAHGFYPDIIFDGAGRAHIVYADGSAGPAVTAIAYTAEQADGSFSAPVILTGTRATTPNFAFAAGKLSLVYQGSFGSGWHIYYQSLQLSQPCVPQFVDTEGNPFKAAIDALYCHHIISGLDDTHFVPTSVSTRAQVAKIVGKALGWSLFNPPAPSFPDVTPDSWAYQFVETAHSHGVMGGYPDGLFLPNAVVTRAQLAKIVVQALGWSIVEPNVATFEDVPISHWAYGYIETAFQHGAVHGVDSAHFEPNRPVRRDELAGIVYHMITPLPLRSTRLHTTSRPTSGSLHPFDIIFTSKGAYNHVV